MSRHFKVTESERSPIIVSALWKQKVNLERDLRILESNKQLVVNRITLNQKIMIKAFKKKLHQAKLSRARIFGDREAEKILRNRSDLTNSQLHTNLGLDAEDEEILKKIWNRSRRIPNADDAESRRLARRATFTKSAPIGRKRTATDKSPDNDGREIIARRPQTVCTIHPALHSKQAMYMCTGQRQQQQQQQQQQQRKQVQADKRTKEQHSDSPSTMTAATTDGCSTKQKHACTNELAVSGINQQTGCESSTLSPINDPGSIQTTNVTVDDHKDQDPDETSSLMEDGHRAETIPATTTNNVFDQDNKYGRLLEIQRERVKSANYERRVSELCRTLTPYVVQKDYVVQDYYQYCMVQDSRAVRGNKVSGFRTPVVQEAEIRRSIGNLDIRSMTLKRLNYNFDAGAERRMSRFGVS